MRLNLIILVSGWVCFSISLLFIIFFEKKNNPIHTSEITHEIRYYDTSNHKSNFKEIPFHEVIEPKIDQLQNIDTANILADYFCKYYYEQQFNDSNIIATIIDTVSKNRILNRYFNYRLKQPKIEVITQEKKVNEVINEHNNKIMFGSFIDKNFVSNKITFGIGGSYSYKKNQIQLQYNPIDNSLRTSLFHEFKW